jgi:long-chain fatty acid transport protein
MLEKRYAILYLALIVNIVVFVTNVTATSFRNPPESASGLGLVGGHIALVDDASALSLSPANLAEVREVHVMGSLTFIYAEADFTGPDGRSGTTDDPLKILPNLHAAWPLQDNLVMGVGLTTPFGQSTEWEKDGPFRYLAPHTARMTTVSISPALATSLGEKWSLGIAANLYGSELELEQMIPWSTIVGAPGLPDGEAKLDGDGAAVGVSLGVTWHPTSRQRVAFTYKSPFDIEYEGDARLNNAPAPLMVTGMDRGDFESEIKFPSIVGVGYGLKLSQKWRVGLDVEWLEFSRYQTLPLKVGSNNVGGLFPSEVPQQWDDTWNIGAAVEWAYEAPWTLRGGYIFMESPIPDETMAPTLPDADRHVVTVGVGYEQGPHALDVTYGYTIFEDREISTSAEPGFNGDYDLSSHLLQVSYRRSF